MNTAAPSSPSSHGTAATGHTAAGSASTRGHGRPASGTPGNTDLFANLLSLLNTGSEPTSDALGLASDTTTDSTTALAQDTLQNTQNPLAGLLGWPGAPLPPMPASAGAVAGSGATGPASLVAATAGPASRGAPAQPGDGLSATPNPATTATTATTVTTAALPADGLTPAPETLSPDTLAALALANTPAEAASADAARGAAPVRITAWRSTTGLAPHTAGLSAAQAVASASPAHASVSQTVFAQATFARASGADGVSMSAPQVRSTVQLDERFEPASADSASSTPSSTSGVHSDALPGVGAGGLAGGGQEGAADLSQGNSSASDQPDTREAAAQAAAEADDSAASSGWGAQHLRHASVRVGEPGEQAIDIQLSMTGQEVRVEFRSDDAQTRASLAQDGGASLGDLLQRSGIDLGAVSVGAQGQQAGQDHPARAPQGPAAQRTAREADTSTSAAAQPPRPRADGSRPLDLFV